MTDEDQNSQATMLAKDLIREFEGCSLIPYLCPAGKWTIGYGNTILDDGTSVAEDTAPLTQEQANNLLQAHTSTILEKVTPLVIVPLTAHQAAALTDFAYNVGIGNFIQSTLLKKLNTDDYEGAAAEFKEWILCNGKILDGLTKRRAEEETLFRRGM